MLKYRFNPLLKQRSTSRWIKHTADVLIPHLPATMEQLVKRTGYSKTSVEKFLVELRQRKIIWTVQSGKMVTYELRNNE